MLAENSIETFCEQLSSVDEPSDAGAASAVIGAFGASLLVKVASNALEENTDEQKRERLREIKEDSCELRNYLIKMVDQDVQVYDDLEEAIHLPEGTDEEKQIKHEATQHAHKKALLVEARIMYDCLDVLEHSQMLINMNVDFNRKDLEIASILIDSAIKASYRHRLEDFKFIEDEQFITENKTKFEEASRKAGQILKNIKKI